MGTLQGVIGPHHKWVEEDGRSSEWTGVSQVCWGEWGAALSVKKVPPLYRSPSRYKTHPRTHPQ